MHNVACVSGLFLFCLSSLLSVLCPMSPVSLDCFCFVCLRCWVFYAECRLCLWIIFVLFVFAVECFMPTVTCVSGLFLFRWSSLLSVLCTMSSVSLDYFCFVCLRCWVFYAQCRLCLWIVFVSFVFAVECFMPNVVCVSGLFLFRLSSLLSVLCPMSPVSLDCFCFVGLRCWVCYAQCRLCL